MSEAEGQALNSALHAMLLPPLRRVVALHPTQLRVVAQIARASPGQLNQAAMLFVHTMTCGDADILLLTVAALHAEGEAGRALLANLAATLSVDLSSVDPAAATTALYNAEKMEARRLAKPKLSAVDSVEIADAAAPHCRAGEGGSTAEVARRLALRRAALVQRVDDRAAGSIGVQWTALMKAAYGTASCGVGCISTFAMARSTLTHTSGMATLFGGLEIFAEVKEARSEKHAPAAALLSLARKTLVHSSAAALVLHLSNAVDYKTAHADILRDGFSLPEAEACILERYLAGSSVPVPTALQPALKSLPVIWSFTLSVCARGGWSKAVDEHIFDPANDADLCSFSFHRSITTIMTGQTPPDGKDGTQYAMTCDVRKCLEPLRIDHPEVYALLTVAHEEEKRAAAAHSGCIATGCKSCVARRRGGRACAREGCDSPSPGGLITYKRCSRCRVVVYCSQSCQLADWPRHREEECVERPVAR